LKVISFYKGKGRNKDVLGGFVCEGEVEGQQIITKVGSGFSDDMRKLIIANQDDWDGACVQVQYFEVTKKNSLRFPVFQTRRKDKE
jgi:ATP-dependent DNA ligase